MPAKEVPNSDGVLVEEATLKWLISEVERLGGKLDNASGFAVNSKTQLATRNASGARPIRPADPLRPIFIITALQTATGCYTLRRVYETVTEGVTVSATATTLSLSTYLTTDTSVNYFGVNLREQGQTNTHDLPINIYVFGEFSTLLSSNDLRVVWIRAIHMGNCDGT